MGFGSKFKNIFNMSEEEYYGDVDIEEDDQIEDTRSSDVRSSGFGFGRRADDDKIVDIRSSAPAQSGSKPRVTIKKLDRYEDVGSVADLLDEKIIVILNLETCPNDVSVRIIDFLSGVAYANRGEMKRIAGRAYIITPINVPLSGELLDGIEHSMY